MLYARHSEAMRFPPRIVRIGALGALASALLIGGPVVATSATAAPAHRAAATAVPGQLSGFANTWLSLICRYPCAS